ncbi:MAG: DUF4145 domain-containing protein [candidate division Zixibacteria bacterium]|nr:DUF4145 domain-containing protein [candidate division Zixibacteria bacterium]
MTYIAPEVFERKFSCPQCGAIANQQWQQRTWGFSNVPKPGVCPLRVAKCDHCENHSLWVDEKMVFPDVGTAPQCNPDMPKAVTEVYSEAALISTKSPRGAAALLRLAVQVLCKELDEKGENLNEDIAELVKKGLPEKVQQALDIVRVTGNNAVHPGQIDVDDEKVVVKLFELVNIIVEYTISMPSRIGEIYSNLPESAIVQIEKRDDTSK